MVYKQIKWWVLAAGLVLGFCLKSFGFSLLGPYAGWMQSTNGYHRPGDVGGPIDIGQGYRWNVPVVTYGFDQSFLDYFGSNGVAAVEGAIKILNNLPPASSLVLSNFPPDNLRFNYTAAALSFFDLKSATLALLLEQMGLAAPTRNIFDLRRFDPILINTDETTWPTGTIPNLIIERNFDPETLAPSHSVNGYNFTGTAYFMYPNIWDVADIAIDPVMDDYDSAVADWQNDWAYPFGEPWAGLRGGFFSGLTRDDVGGLRYLLSTNTFQLETLLSDVHASATNTGALVNLALRPGVEKITFVRQQYDALLDRYIPMTNHFADTYVSNITVMHQSLERTVTQPDFLFSAGDLVASFGMAPAYTRTETSNWWNSANTAGTTNAGPGVIRPQVKITFGHRGPFVRSEESIGYLLYDYEDFRWASFDGTLAPIVIYPEGSTFPDADKLKIQLNLIRPDSTSPIVWQVPVAFGGHAVLQTSTNLLDWVSITNVPNHGGHVDWDYWYPQQPQRFFRAVPQ